MKPTTIQDLSDFNELFATISSENIKYFPVRHHSPACSYFLKHYIQKLEPDYILVEGPHHFSHLIPQITDDDLKPPFAIYTTFENKKTKQGEEGRQSSFYPFCDYSPELVALRAGKEIGAHMEFFDLGFPEQIENERTFYGNTPKLGALIDDVYLRRSVYLQSLAKNAGCRDEDELWDHWFESRVKPDEPANIEHTLQFINHVAAYCAMARRDYTDEMLQAEGTFAREKFMAERIAELIDSVAVDDTNILIVTGGFHTIALPRLVKKHKKLSKIRKSPECDNYLIQYSFDQIDRLSGYGAGMPSPYFHQLNWDYINKKISEPPVSTLLTEIARQSTKKKLDQKISTADTIQALVQANTMASLKGRKAVTREDIFDAVRSCYVKGSIEIEGLRILEIAKNTLSGDRIGQLPSTVSLPPVLQEFKRHCESLGIKLDQVHRKRWVLDIYRKTKHQKISRWLHCLNFIGSPFARLVSSPQFFSGSSIKLTQEEWEISWSPLVDSHLIDLSIHGVSIKEICLYRLKERQSALVQTGESRDAMAMVTLLVEICRMGIQETMDTLMGDIQVVLNEEENLVHQISALQQLLMLGSLKPLLNLTSLAGVEEIYVLCYQRICYLLRLIITDDTDYIREILQNLSTMRELIVASDAETELSDNDSTIDRQLLIDSLEHRLSEKPMLYPVLYGAYFGLLYGLGQKTDRELTDTINVQFLSAYSKPAERVGFFYGLISTHRDLLWHHEDIIKTLSDLLEQWSDHEFLTLLPEVRLVFSELTPNEIDRVAENISDIHNTAPIGTLYHDDINDEILMWNVNLSMQVSEILNKQGLGDWISQGKK